MGRDGTGWSLCTCRERERAGAVGYCSERKGTAATKCIPWTGERIKDLGREFLSDPQCPAVTSPPVDSRMQWHCQHVLTSVEIRLILAPQNLLHPHLWPEAECQGSTVYGLQNPRSSSSLQLSLGPEALCVRRPLHPAKCPRGHSLCTLGIWAAYPCTATSGCSRCRHHSHGGPTCCRQSSREAGPVHRA